MSRRPWGERGASVSVKLLASLAGAPSGGLHTLFNKNP